MTERVVLCLDWKCKDLVPFVVQQGMGTDEKAIISVLAKITNAERQKVSIAFKQMYGKDLIKVRGGYFIHVGNNHHHHHSDHHSIFLLLISPPPLLAFPPVLFLCCCYCC